MKKFIGCLTALSMITAAVMLPVSADDSIKVLIDGEEITFDTKPVLLNDRTMVPMRAIFERLGAEVQWDASLRTVTAVKGKNTMVLKLDDNKMYKNGAVIPLDTAPVIIDDYTMIPLRAVSENLGVSVDWNEESRTAFIATEEKDKDDTWKENTGTINLSAKTVTGDGISVSGSDIEITQGGDFTVTGSMTDGMIHINTKERVKLRLCGVQITNSTGPAIFFEDSDKGYITLSEGTENKIACGVDYDADAKAAIFSNDDLEIKGQGRLSVTAEGHHGIASDDEIEIGGGNLEITAAKDGLHANDGIYITEGDIKITADGDGIQSEDVLSVTGGNISITTRGAAAVNYNSPTEGLGGMGWSKGARKDAEQEISPAASPEPSSQTDVNTEAVSAKGIKAETGLYIGGGTIAVSSTDHSVHSAGSILIAGGGLTLSSSVKKAVSGHGDVTVNGGDITVLSATEGIESKACLTVNGGIIKITCTDDGLNAGGNDTQNEVNGEQPPELPEKQHGEPFGKGMMQEGGEGMKPPENQGYYPAEGMQPPQNQDGQKPQMNMEFGKGGPGRGGGMMYSAEKQIIINGGYLLINAQGDGIDSNGDLTINGGTILVNGPTSNGDGALDTNGTIYQNGGVLIAVGSSGMMEAPGEGSSQPSIAGRFSETIESGTLLYIQDSAGNTVAAFTPEKNYASAVFSSPKLTEGETYTIYKGGTVSGENVDGYYAEGVCGGGEVLVSVQAALNNSSAGIGPGFGRPEGGRRNDSFRQMPEQVQQ